MITTSTFRYKQQDFSKDILLTTKYMSGPLQSLFCKMDGWFARLQYGSLLHHRKSGSRVIGKGFV